MAEKTQQGDKTHEQFLRNLERKGDMDDTGAEDPAATPTPHHPQARQSEFAVSERGMNQESRGHNKHNHSGQSGHKPQQHSPAEEKH
jgi:hypothetical protein